MPSLRPGSQMEGGYEGSEAGQQEKKEGDIAEVRATNTVRAKGIQKRGYAGSKIESN